MNPRIGSLFSGYGGLDLAVEAVTGATPAWFVEFDAAPSKILAHHWPDVPNYGDVTAVDWATVPRVDILTGGTPCQDLSAAGKRAGMTEGTRSNLWVNMREAINIIRPKLVVWENVLGALSAKATSDSDMEPGSGPLGDGGGGHLRALGRVLGDLAEIGYDATWTTIRASDVGAPHHRARVFLIGYPQEVPDSEGGGWDHGQATHDGQADREVHSPRHDSDAAADTGGIPLREHSGESPTEEAGPEGCNRSSDPSRERSPRDGRDSGAADSGGERRDQGAEQPGAGTAEVTAPLGGHTPATDSDVVGSQAGHERPVGHGAEVPVTDGGGEALSHTQPVRRENWATPSEKKIWGAHGEPGGFSTGINWGEYAPAIRRWERIIGPAPAPTEPNTKGNPRLAAAFAEWLMGLPAGWITGVPGLSRADQLKAIGNGVVPQQAAAALEYLLAQTHPEMSDAA